MRPISDDTGGEVAETALAVPSRRRRGGALVVVSAVLLAGALAWRGDGPSTRLIRSADLLPTSTTVLLPVSTTTTSVTTPGGYNPNVGGSDPPQAPVCQK